MKRIEIHIQIEVPGMVRMGLSTMKTKIRSILKNLIIRPGDKLFVEIADDKKLISDERRLW